MRIAGRKIDTFICLFVWGLNEKKWQFVVLETFEPFTK